MTSLRNRSRISLSSSSIGSSGGTIWSQSTPRVTLESSSRCCISAVFTTATSLGSSDEGKKKDYNANLLIIYTVKDSQLWSNYTRTSTFLSTHPGCSLHIGTT